MVCERGSVRVPDGHSHVLRPSVLEAVVMKMRMEEAVQTSSRYT